MNNDLRAPFPWTGGKYWVADPVWEAVGADVAHYVEPFGGSMAVLLARPDRPRVETVNDIDHYLVNFWRASKIDPASVASHTINPVSEADLYARNAALIQTSDVFRQCVLNDPEFFDPKVAGWWVWGQSTVIGRTFANDICKKMPSLLHAGVNSLGADIPSWIERIAERLQAVRILCGDWKRCLGPTALGLNKSPRIRTAGVFLDPPYAKGDYKYAGTDPRTIWTEARQWAIDHGSEKHLRIVLAGYDDGDEMPEGWTAWRWTGHGGLGRKSAGANTNKHREVLWMSPHCLRRQVSFDDLFSDLPED